MLMLRSRSHCDAPLGHGSARIELGRLAERTQRLIPVEPVHHRETLIEKLLRLGTAGLNRVLPNASACALGDRLLIAPRPGKSQSKARKE